jgi:hypothetical protein
MKKILLISSIIFGGMLFGQNSKFDKIYSTQELIKLQNSVTENEKHDFYNQFFKANLFENIKTNFKSKKYTDIVLKKFADTIISAHYWGEDEEFEPEKIMSFEEYEKQQKQGEIVRKESLEKMKKENKKMYELFVEMGKGLDKIEATGDINKDYEKYVADVKDRNENDPYSEKNKKLLIQKLDVNFSSKKYFSDETRELLEKNFNLALGSIQYFPIPVSKHVNEGEIYEVIPNDILAFEMNNGYAAGRHTLTYKIVGDNIIPINVFPYDTNYNINNSFDKKLTTYIKKGYRFEDRTGYDMTKNKNGEYVITTPIFSDDDANVYASMMVEYKTKDFKNYTPLRVQKNIEKNKWTVIK